jgi:phage tail sheath protein FI
MPFQLSPGVVVTEYDLTTVVPSVAVSIGGLVGDFQWGPAEEITMIDSENRLKQVFGSPNANTYVSFFTAASYLSYSNKLKVVRSVGAAAKNASGNANALFRITNLDYYTATFPSGNTIAKFAARYPGSLGNAIKVSLADAGSFATWGYASQFSAAPSTSTHASTAGASNDELHLIVIDVDGRLSGVAGTVLEKYAFVSKATDAKTTQGGTNYYADVLNNQSKYLWWLGHPAGSTGTGNSTVTWGTTANTGAVFANLSSNVTTTLVGGSDAAPVNGNLQVSFDLFKNDEAVDVNFLILGNADATVTNYVTQNIAEVRKDCIAFASPPLANVLNNVGSEASAISTYRGTLTSSSYVVLDSGWKYMYDKYNDVYRWVPLNGDIAGLCARTDMTNDPWWSPAGLNRGIIKNAVKLAYSPRAADRDTLYLIGVNPVISTPGQGTYLYGDKTLLSRPSAFDRINVRRLFIILEKSIAIAAKYSLFEFNDSFTRAQFKNLVEPYLRDIKGRRGITDFKVVCDETNNTPEVIDRNEFVASIFIKPARSINFITLNFVATRTGVEFSEVAGAI